MFNKRGERTTVEFTVSLIITIIVLVVFAGCGYKLINPNCDPSSVDVYNKFVKYYEGCIEKEGDCGNFDFSDLPSKHNIIIKPSGVKLENTIISLGCNGRESFRNKKKIDVKLCFKDGKIKLAGQDDLIDIVSLDKKLSFFRESSDKICFVGKTTLEEIEEEEEKWRKEYGKKGGELWR